MQIITGKDSNGIYRVIDTDDMTVAFIDDNELKYYRSLGIKFRQDKYADSWYELLNLLTKHTVVSKDLEYPVDFDELKKMHDLLRRIEDRFKKFNLPCSIVNLKINHISSTYFITINNIFICMISRKVCKLVYRILDNDNFMVKIESGGEEGKFHIILNRLSGKVIHNKVITVNEIGKILGEDEFIM